MITDRRKFAAKLTLYKMFIFSIFTVRSISKSFPWAVRSVQETYLPKFSATSDVRYCVLEQIVRSNAGAAWRPIYARKAD